MTMRPDPTFHASPKLAMEAPPENFAFELERRGHTRRAVAGHRGERPLSRSEPRDGLASTRMTALQQE